MDDFRIYNRALSDMEIGGVITSGKGDKAGWYHFDELSGTNAPDSTGGENDATLNNGAAFVAGRTGNAVDLDGTNDYVSMPSGIVSSLNDFTISTWVYLDTLGGFTRIFDFGTGTNTYMYLTPPTGTGARFSITTSGGSNEQRWQCGKCGNAG